ncbi:acyl carrier protein [Nocardia transvalensis]|uniref:acyl carrier protein n=1 Tax=Nocardia transvalensis TaxID=37333 RepID=UPI001893F569|nr:phosphopantetheine-binding protein [Nocardia transvalensis]MBF6331946.1 acyl carrier protein [Nocardia transvalensis]
MDRNLIRERVVAMLSETLEIPQEELSDEQIDLRDDLGMTSIDFVDLIELLEGHLGRTVNPEELVDVRTIGDAVDLVIALLSSDTIAPGNA